MRDIHETKIQRDRQPTEQQRKRKTRRQTDKCQTDRKRKHEREREKKGTYRYTKQQAFGKTGLHSNGQTKENQEDREREN